MREKSEDTIMTAIDVPEFCKPKTSYIDQVYDFVFDSGFC